MERSVTVRYQRVASEQELLDGLSQPGAVILCGGTDAIVKMRAGMIHPELLLDITGVESMQGIAVVGPHLEIGAATLESDILRSPLVGSHVPLLAAVIRQLGSVQIRNRGTLGGNVVNASPAADSAIPLLLYDAELMIVSPTSARWLRLEEFFTGPGRTTLASGEFVRTLRLPIPEDPLRPFFHKVGKRNALTIAIASLGTLLRLEGETIREVRIAAGSVAPTPKRLHAVEHQLVGTRLCAATIADARTLIMEAISPISDIRATAEYRRNVIGDLLVRALQFQQH
jgi:CO/xanthine dehydrogenase FAD-binding subunit